MKKILCLLLVFVSIFILTSCNISETPDDSNDIDDNTNINPPQEEIYYENPFQPIEEGNATIELNKNAFMAGYNF